MVELKDEQIEELVIDTCKIGRVRIVNSYINDVYISHNTFKYMRLNENSLEKLTKSRNMINGEPDILEFP